MIFYFLDTKFVFEWCAVADGAGEFGSKNVFADHAGSPLAEALLGEEEAEAEVSHHVVVGLILVLLLARFLGLLYTVESTAGVLADEFRHLSLVEDFEGWAQNSAEQSCQGCKGLLRDLGFVAWQRCLLVETVQLDLGEDSFKKL